MKRRSVLECGTPPPHCLPVVDCKPQHERVELVVGLSNSARGLAQCKTWRKVAAVVCVFAASLPLSHGQNLAIDWFTIDGGGGASSGGAYAVSGTVGQPDAGAMSGGSYSLVSGFWSAVVPTPGAPPLAIVHSGESVIVSWPLAATGFVLEQNSALTRSNWMEAPCPYATNATQSSLTVPASVGNTFYRLRKP